MNCLEKYRSRLIGDINRDLKIIRAKLDEKAIHDFRVGIKRLTALYYFLGDLSESMNAKKTLKPYRRIFKSVSGIRDAQIALTLIGDLEGIDETDRKTLLQRLRRNINSDYRRFQRYAAANAELAIRVPTIRALKLSEAAILRYKPLALDRLLQQVFDTEGRIGVTEWHRKRILLKRYRHKLDAFLFCPGHNHDEAEMKQIRMLEQLLGDWHDRITTIELLHSLSGLETRTAAVIAIMRRQDKLLLGAARIYLQKFKIWHARQAN